MVVSLRMVRGSVLLFFLICVVSLLLGSASYATEREAEKVGKKKEAAMTRAELRHELMRFASSAGDRVGQAYLTFESESQTPQARRLALEGVLVFWESALEIAIGPDPGVNLLDMVVMVTLTREVTEAYWVPKVFGERAKGVLEALRTVEAEIWAIASKVLTLQQQQELRDAIQEWRKRNPDQIFVEFVRFGDFAGYLGESALAKAQQSGGFLGISGAKRSVDEALLLAERAMFYVQRMPAIARFQAKLVVYDLTEQPQMKQLVSDTNTLAQAMGQLAETTERLPEQIEKERRAAIGQVAEMLEQLPGRMIRQLAAERDDLMPLITPLVLPLEVKGAEWVDHAFRRGVVLIVILLGGFVLAMLTYRFASERLFGPR